MGAYCGRNEAYLCSNKRLTHKESERRGERTREREKDKDEGREKEQVSGQWGDMIYQ